MSGVARVGRRFLRWEALDLARRLRGHPVTKVSLGLGLPAVIAAYAIFGHVIGTWLLDQLGDGREAFADALTRGARFFAGIVVVMGAGGVVGQLFHRRPRETLLRYRHLPLSDFQLYRTRRIAEDGALFALFLAPMFGVVAARLLFGGAGAFLAALAFVGPCVVTFYCVVAVRAAVLVGLFVVPERVVSWRAGLWLTIAAVAFFVQPMSAVVSALWTRAAATVVPPTDWIAGAALAWLSDDVALALALVLAARLVAAHAAWVDFALFRAILLRRFDRLLARLGGTGLSRGRMTLVGRLLERLPGASAGAPLRAMVAKDVLRVARDPVLSLAVQVPVLVVALSAAAFEVTVHQDFAVAGQPSEIGAMTRDVTLAFLGIALVGGALAAAALLVAWEDRRLGGLRALPWSEDALYLAKARAASVIVGCAFVGTWLGFLAIHGPAPGIATWVQVALVPPALLVAAWLVGRTATTVGALFARFDAQNPLLGIGFAGLSVHLLASGLALASVGGSLLAPAWLGPRYLFIAPAVALAWWIALPVLRLEGRRALRRHRIG